MSYQPFTELPENAVQQMAQRKPLATSSRPFQSRSSSSVLQLQRTLGNQRVGELIQAKGLTPEGGIIGLQPKLTVGTADDQYEREADHVARQVMSMPEPGVANPMQRATSSEEDKDKMLQTKPLAASITPFVQRQKESSEEPEEKETPIQTKSESDFRSPIQRACAACSLGSEEKSGSESH